MRKKLLDQMYKLKTELVDACPDCNGSGIRDGEECECRVVQHYLNLLIEAKIPVEYWSLSFDDLTSIRPEELVETAEYYAGRLKVATTKSLGLMLMGANGRGKTSIQCAVGKKAIIEGYSVQYLTAQQYVEAVKERDTDLLEEYGSAHIILLDELDKVYIAQNSKFVPKIIEEFIRRMISSGVSFIICTNLSEEGVVRTFGESTVSMLKGHLRFMRFLGEDYRKTQNQAWLDMMEDGVEYRSPHIVEYAYKLWNREEQEQTVGWQETH